MTETTEPKSHLSLLPDVEPDFFQRDGEAQLGRMFGKHRPRRMLRIVMRGWLIERQRTRKWQHLFKLARIEAEAERSLKAEAFKTYTDQVEEIDDLRKRLEAMTDIASSIRRRMDEIRGDVAARAADMKGSNDGRA